MPEQKKTVPTWGKFTDLFFYICTSIPLCVPSDSDPNFQKSYQNLTTFGGEILPNSDSKFWLGGNN